MGRHYCHGNQRLPWVLDRVFIFNRFLFSRKNEQTKEERTDDRKTDRKLDGGTDEGEKGRTDGDKNAEANKVGEGETWRRRATVVKALINSHLFTPLMTDNPHLGDQGCHPNRQR